MGEAAKGHMLDEVLNAILDFIGPGHYAAALLRSERVNHENLGVDPQVFMVFFAVVRESFRELARPDWTPRMDRAWDDLLNGFAAALASERIGT